MNMHPFLRTLFIIHIGCNLSANGQDWPALNRYRLENSKLNTDTNLNRRVIFLGNSITDFWIKSSSEFFENNHYIDRGISGQTSPQMLLRFRADVIKLHPKVVVIECGTNDIAGNTGPSTLAMIEDNIMSMAELSRVNKIKVILASVLPAIKFGWKPDVKPADSIIALNEWIKDYAKGNHFTYLDYYSSLVDENKGMRKEFSEDGVHPNKQGYLVMEGLALQAIEKVLNRIYPE